MRTYSVYHWRRGRLAERIWSGEAKHAPDAVIRAIGGRLDDPRLGKLFARADDRDECKAGAK